MICPADLKKALTSDAKALETWEDITPLARNEWICWIESAKQALAAYEVMKTHGRTSIKIGGCDAMPPALQAVTDGRMVATVRRRGYRRRRGRCCIGEKTGTGTT